MDKHDSSKPYLSKLILNDDCNETFEILSRQHTLIF
jgi:hypothetical protein